MSSFTQSYKLLRIGAIISTIGNLLIWSWSFLIPEFSKKSLTLDMLDEATSFANPHSL